MSGISGGNYGGNRDLTDKEDAMYQRQIDAIRAGKLPPKRRVRTTGRHPSASDMPKADPVDDE